MLKVERNLERIKERQEEMRQQLIAPMLCNGMVHKLLQNSIKAILAALFLFSSYSFSLACDTNFDCGMGAVCIKKFGKGQCYKMTDQNGNPSDTISPDDFVNKHYQMKKYYYCESDSDCPRGSFCNYRYNVCVR